MFRINEAAKDYALRILGDGTFSPTDVLAIGYTAILLVRWQGYSAHVTGIGLISVVNDEVFPTADGWSLSVVLPALYHADLNYSGPGLTFKELKIILRGVTFTVDAFCDAWEISWTSMEVYIDGALQDTLGAYSESGTGFDKRLDCPHISAAISVPTSQPINAPGCAEISVDQEAVYTYEGTAHAIGGYKRDDGAGLEAVPIQYDNILSPAELCSCAEGLPPITWHDSWDVQVTDFLHKSQSVDGYETFTCPCPPGVAVFERYVKTETYRRRAVEADIMPIDAGIFKTERHTSESCNGVTSDTDATTTESITWSQFRKTSTKTLGQHKCIHGVDPSGCLGIGGVDPPPPCDTTWSTFCIYTGLAELLWPELPPCGGVTLWPWNHETPDGRLFRCDVRDGDVWVVESNFHVPPWNVETKVTTTGDCIRPTIAEDFRSRLFLTYARLDGSDNPTSYLRFSDDEATSFSSETSMAIANGTYPMVATAPDGGVILAALVYNSGTSGPGKIYIQYWSPGTHYADIPAAVPIRDAAGSDIVAADTTFYIDFAYHESAGMVLSVVIDGESATSEWISWNEDPDDAGYFTFKRLT
jgi:hypothetical protein